MRNNKVKILVDNPNSWMIPYAKTIIINLKKKGFNSELITSHEDIKSGFCLFLLSCSKKLKNLKAYDHNIVIHASDLPSGKGWSPLTWQVLEGKNSIPISVFEANDKIDAGKIYIKTYLKLLGHELIEEIREKLYIEIENLIFKFLDMDKSKAIVQTGEETFYSRRNKEDSELDIKKSIESQFNLLRVCDNEKYPAFFNYGDQKFILKIYKSEDDKF